MDFLPPVGGARGAISIRRNLPAQGSFELNGKRTMVTDEKMIQRLTEIKGEFRKLLDFHEKSFAEIDAKARYWLTLTLPSFIALMGYLFNQGAAMAVPLLVATCALASCLFASTILFSSVLVSRRVESGILAPTSRDIVDLA